MAFDPAKMTRNRAQSKKTYCVKFNIWVLNCIVVHVRVFASKTEYQINDKISNFSSSPQILYHSRYIVYPVHVLYPSHGILYPVRSPSPHFIPQCDYLNAEIVKDVIVHLVVFDKMEQTCVCIKGGQPLGSLWKQMDFRLVSRCQNKSRKSVCVGVTNIDVDSKSWCVLLSLIKTVETM